MSGTIFEISLSHRQNLPSRKTEATDFLLQSGFSCFEISYTELKSLMKVCAYTPDMKRVRTAEKGFTAWPVRGWKLQIRALEDRDWLTKWQEDFRIFPIGKKFSIVPKWKENEFKGRRLPIFLDPEAAFGSGRHATTKLALGVMESLEGKYRSFMDMGMGTGVLMIAASRLGAETVHGFDFDPGSVKTARLNLKYNGVKNARVIRQNLMTYKPAQKYDLVLANMISKTLTDGQRNIAAAVKPGGHLITSGIMIKNLPGYLKTFRPAGLRRLKVIRGRSWAACLYRKN